MRIMVGILSNTLCDNQLSWLEEYLSKSKENIGKLRKSWHKVYVNLSQETKEVVKELRSRGFPVISFDDRTHVPYAEIIVNGPESHRLEFNGLGQITKYFSVLDNFKNTSR